MRAGRPGAATLGERSNELIAPTVHYETRDWYLRVVTAYSRNYTFCSANQRHETHTEIYKN